MRDWLFKARDTVVWETLAILAISFIVVFFPMVALTLTQLS